MKIAFVGAFSIQLAEPVRALVSFPCEIITGDEVGVIPRLHDVDVLVTMRFSQEMANAAQNLQLVQVAGAGLDRIERGALRPQTKLANVYGHEVEIAEYVVGAMIALTRSFVRLDERLREGHWESQWAIGRPVPPLMPELLKKTLAILGFGHIGQAVAQRAAAFDMEIVAIRRNWQAGKPNEAVSIVGLDQIDDVLRKADFVVITLPLSDETRHLIDANRLGLMKRSAYLVNVARGEIVEGKALYDALAGRQIAGAALDVWYRYPTTADPMQPSTQPFHELDNVIMTPHVSGWTDGMLTARAKLIAENIERAARGEVPRNAIGSAL